MRPEQGEPGMINTLNLNLLKSIMSARQSGAQANVSTGDGFAGILAAAGEKADGKTLAQLANIVMLRNMSRLWNDSPDKGSSASAGLPGLSAQWGKPVLPAGVRSKLEKLEKQAAAPAAIDAGKILPEDEASEGDNTMTSRQNIDDIIRQSADRHGLEESLVRAVVTAESDFNPSTVSKAGAMGLMQLMPETAADLGVTDPFDPAQNVEGGTRYLAMMLERFGGDRDKALAAYNWGPSNVERGGSLPEETRNYLKKIERFQAIYDRGFSAKV